MAVGVIRALWVDHYIECFPKIQRAKLVGTTMPGRLRDRKQTKYSQKIIYGSG